MSTVDTTTATSRAVLPPPEPARVSVTGIRTTTSLVWRRGPEGWRIVREHNSTTVIPLEEAEQLLAAGLDSHAATA